MILFIFMLFIMRRNFLASPPIERGARTLWLVVRRLNSLINYRTRITIVNFLHSSRKAHSFIAVSCGTYPNSARNVGVIGNKMVTHELLLMFSESNLYRMRMSDPSQPRMRKRLRRSIGESSTFAGMNWSKSVVLEA